VLIGTRETVAGLAAQLRVAAPGVKAAGAILLDAGGRPLDAGLPILGGIAQLPDAHRVLGFTLAIVSLPSTSAAEQMRVRARLRELGIPERTVPPLAELLDKPTPTRLSPTDAPADIDVVELIGRMPYGIDRRAVAEILEGKRIVITGAGGSIGSELARIAATFRPEQLILMERSENALFEIDRQIARRFPDVPRRSMLHDVVDQDQTLRHMVKLKPHAVFHAAAHKHVPLMEDHPAHAVTNNLFGTKSMADAAVAVGAERFVLVSSDKAVNPTSVMGATKRLAEIYVQSLHGKGPTRAAMVRFGNVLGSACSVLPIWSAQLSEGGPVTVTDPRMTRYFMTIHEAATLVIQSAAIDPKSATGAVFVLDMGEPVKILDLAMRFVRAHGFVPRLRGQEASAAAGEGRPEIEVQITGARPGEKLHEELAYAAENLLPTPFPGIRAWAGRAAGTLDAAGMIAELSALRHSPDRDAVISGIRRWVPEMKSGGENIQVKYEQAKESTGVAA
jgi:FlaA1/EpsC-like NDP-sugar epimerase